MATLKDVFEHLVLHSSGYPTNADRQEHLDALAALDGDPPEAPKTTEKGM
jgi:hypothetical protein